MNNKSMKIEIETELVMIRNEFHALLNSLSDDDLQRPSGNQAWTIAELLYHISLAPRLLKTDLMIIRGAPWAYRLIGLFPKSWFDWLNVLFTRGGARTQDRQSIAAEYDRAHQSALKALGTIQADEWRKGILYPDWDEQLSGFTTVEKLFHYPAVHFRTHAQDIRSALKTARNASINTDG